MRIASRRDKMGVGIRVTHLGFTVPWDCSVKISLVLRPVSLTIQRLRRTFRVSRQCHRAATMGSMVDRMEWSENAASGSTAAEGGCSGRALKSLRRWGGRVAIDLASSSDINGGSDEDLSDGLFSWARRFGNIKCWIQYDVPPTTIGISFFLWVPSI